MASPGSVVIQFLAKADKARRDILRLSDSLEDVDDSAGTVDGSLSDAQRAIDRTGDMARDSARPLDTMSTNLDHVGDDAELTADRLRRAAGDMADGVRQGAQGIDVETGRIRGNMGEVGREAGTEFIGNIAEGIGSGQADVNDVISGTLGGITNLAAQIPGIGAVAGAAAAGAGILFSKIKADTEKVQESVENLIEAFLDLEDRSAAAVTQAAYDEWLAKIKETPADIQKITSGLQDVGINQATWTDAIAGNLEAQQRVRDAIAESTTKIVGSVDSTYDLTDAQQSQLGKQKLIIDQIDNQNRALGISVETVDDIDWLTGKAKGSGESMSDTWSGIRSKTGDVKDDVDAIAGTHEVVFRITKKGQTMGEVLEGIPRTAAPTVGTQAVQPVAVNVYTTGPAIPSSPRAVRALLEGHDLRMGRRPGTPRAVAW